jgi:group I intron endonuclease
MKQYGIIYKFTNKVNSKIYIGLTTLSIEDRLYAHCNRGNREKSVFQKALKKYGKDNFSYEIIDTALSRQELIQKEINWIAFYNSTDAKIGYNRTKGGDGQVGMTEETKAKISKKKKGSKIPKLLGRVRSQEERSKISRSLGGSKILAKNLDGQKTFTLETAHDGKNYGFNPSLICAVIKGKRNFHKGFVFYKLNDVNTESN